MASVVTVIVDISTVLILTTFSILMRQLLEPYHRGFNKNDESLMYPFKSSTISATTLYVVGLCVPSFLVMLLEGFHVFYQNERVVDSCSPSMSCQCEKSAWLSWLQRCYNFLIYFFFGVALTNLATNIPKYVIGRLRPHFLEVCQPDWLKLNSTAGYITENICTNTDPLTLREARLSFPSGHASISMYCMMYAILYVEEQWPWDLPWFLRPLLQFALFVAAFLTGLTRISDYKHHWSDVLAGSVLGAVVAWLIVVKVRRRRRRGVNKVSSKSNSKNDECTLEAVITANDDDADTSVRL